MVIISACRLLEQCIFFKDKMADMPSTAKSIKARYCWGGGSSTCARYLVSEKLGADKVPQDLLPSQTDRIEEIFNEI